MNINNSGQFDGNAAFSGGGFMPSQATQTADNTFSSAKSRDAQPLLPLTVKQISEALQSSDDKSNFLIDGVDVNNVTLVGMVHNKAERVTDVSFVLDDATGRIDCIKWVNETMDSKEMEGIIDGMYIRVHGHLKGFQGKRQLVVFSVRAVTDNNEIAYHFIEAISVHLYNAKLRLQGGAPATQMPDSGLNTPSKGYQTASQNQFAGHYSMDGLKDIDKMVMDYLQQPSCLVREKGVHRDELAQRLNVPVKRILQAIGSLEEEGLIYSTIDEFHYKSTVDG